MKIKFGLIVNPIAGMGGRVGLKGTDSPEVLEEARNRGAEERAVDRARQALEPLVDLLVEKDVTFITCSGKMGYDAIDGFPGLKNVVIYNPLNDSNTSQDDTRKAAELIKQEGVDLLLFCGGDGTARDVSGVVGTEVPILGIPAGVKMHSAVFATTPHGASEVIKHFLKDEYELLESEVMDIDEDAYRDNRLDVKLYGYSKIPFIKEWVQACKEVFPASSQKVFLEEISDFFSEIVKERPNTLFLFGAGSTVGAIKKWLGMKGTLLGIDAYLEDKQVGSDLNEQGILELIESSGCEDLAVCITPIGSQGFILGRGSQQFSPNILRRLKKGDLYIISTPQKLQGIEGLKVDTSDPELDREMKGFVRVITGYKIHTMFKIV